MFQIDRKLSVLLSYIFAIVGFIALAGFCVFSVNELLYIWSQAEIDVATLITTLVVSALIASLVALADAMLLLLLRNVRTNRIFSSQSVQYLRIISWNSIAVGILSFPLCFLWKLFPWIMLFIGLFLGLILRVVKNVIEEAVAIKEDNDGVI